MCAPSRPSAPPAPAPAPAPQREPVTDKRVRRVGKTMRGGSPSQRGRGVLIRSKNPLGVNASNARSLGTRRSLLVPMTELDVSVGGY